MLKKDETNSICSDEETTTNESFIIKEKHEVDEEEEDEDDDEDNDEDDDEDEEEEEEDDDDDDDDDDDEFDSNIIQFELLKNFLVDKNGDNITTHLGSVAHELRKLNKIAVKLLEKK